jgi:AcrR family transcriptional regulator
MSANESSGLRERKKAATREALRAAALRLALEHGPENVRVDEIAEAAGVSPRTYNNYFASREQAIIAAITAERALRISAELRARPSTEPLAEAVTEAVVALYEGPPAGDALLLITSAPALRAEFAETASSIEQPLAAAIADRIGGDELAAAVLAAAVAATARTALQLWARPSKPGSALVVPQGCLPDLLRAALTHMAPALRAAESA